MAPRRLELNKEYPEPDEDALAQQLIDHEKALLDITYGPGGYRRDFHAKTQTAVRAFLVREPDLDAKFRFGVFQEARTWPVWIRFSNAAEKERGDLRRDARGMALKLVGVEGEKLLDSQRDAQTQDFLFFTPPTFFTPDARSFSEFIQVYHTHSWIRLGWYGICHLRIIWIILRSIKHHANLLESWYYSATPYMLGSNAVKHLLRPHKPATSTIPKDGPDNYLRERLKQDLAQGEARFDFLVQFQADPYKTPIEDASVEWKESIAPYHKVATLIIPRQTFDSPAQMQFGENLSMNPWHSLPEHRPLGNVNRMRRKLYDAISTFRHQRNGVPPQEPTLESFEQFGGLPMEQSSVQKVANASSGK
jgi:Catalase